MFKLFKRKKSTQEKTAKVTDKAAGLIARSILKMQRLFADNLSKYEKHLTIRQKKIGLLVFCLCMGSLSATLIYKGIFSEAGNVPAYLQKNSIIRPENAVLPDSLNVRIIEEYKKSQELKRKLDSINK